jgi:hypothetical protein
MKERANKWKLRDLMTLSLKNQSMTQISLNFTIHKSTLQMMINTKTEIFKGRDQ